MMVWVVLLGTHPQVVGLWHWVACHKYDIAQWLERPELLINL